MTAPKAIKYIVVIVLYLLLFIVTFYSLITFIKEPTAFEELDIEGDAKIPSFTICPYYSTDLLQTFEDVNEGIKEAKLNWNSSIKMYKPFG